MVPINIYDEEEIIQEEVSGKNTSNENVKKLKFGTFSKRESRLKTNNTNFKFNKIYILYIFIALGCIYMYKSQILTNIKELPSLKEESNILNTNLESAKKELDTLKKIDTNNLDSKQNVIDNAIPDKNITEQIGRILTVAKESGLNEISGIKITDTPSTQDQVKKFGDSLDKDVQNFLTNSFYTTYKLTFTTSEVTFKDFYKRLRTERLEFVPAEYGLTPKDGSVGVEMTLYGFYPLK